jgi:hypothetical protein
VAGVVGVVAMPLATHFFLASCKAAAMVILDVPPTSLVTLSINDDAMLACSAPTIATIASKVGMSCTFGLV